MFDSLLGRKFSNKCKHAVKCIRCRLETIRKKKEAMVRYLKKDVADLISCGHEAIALGRMDSLIFEINQASCYAMIEHYCCCIVEHLPTMQKDRVCPEGAVEAVATLIFAAARFSDLRELADLRHLFAERYETHMEAYINEEFVEKVQKNSFPKDKKLQLMQEIAVEFSVNWDVKAFEHKLSNPCAPTLAQPEKKLLSSNGNNKKFQTRVEEREIGAERTEIDRGRKLVPEENSVPASGARRLEKQQAKSDPKNTTSLKKEDKRVIETTDMNVAQKDLRHHWGASQRSFNGHCHQLDSSQKIDKVASNEAEIVGLHHFDTQPSRDKSKDKLSRSHADERIHDSNSYKRAAEPGLMAVEKQGAETMVSRDEKAAYLTPPYTRYTGQINESGASLDDFARSSSPEFKEMDQNPQWWKTQRTIYPESKRSFHPKPPYVKAISERKHLSQTTVDQKSSGCSQSKETEDGSSYHSRRVSRMLSDQPTHRGHRVDDDREEGAANVQGEGGIMVRERPSGAASAPLETNGQGETVGRRHGRSVSMQPEVRSPSFGHVHSRLPADYNDLAVRIAALRRS